MKRQFLVPLAVIAVILTLCLCIAAQKGKPTPLVCPSPKPPPATDTYCTSGSGCIDTGWGVNGFAQIAIPNSGGLNGSRVILAQPDGKIVVAGSTYINKYDFFVARFNADGSVDTSFGEPDPLHPFLRKGYVIVDYGGETNTIETAMLQSDGGIVVGGGGRYVGWITARFTSDGELDPTFGDDGIVTIDMKEGSIVGMAIQADGKLLFAGSQNYTVARLNTDGSLDNTFGTSGKVTHKPSTSSKDTGRVYSIDLQRLPAGTGPEHIVLGGTAYAGASTRRMATMRLTPNGALHTTYGTGGRSYTDPGPYEEILHRVRIDGQNRILAVGQIKTAAVNCGSYPDDVILARYTENGTLDGGFGTNGLTISDIYGGSDIVEHPGLELDTYGRIHVTGQGRSADSSVIDFFLIRYLADGLPDPAFGPGTFGPGLVTLNYSSPETAVGVAFQPDGGIITGGITLGPVTLFKYFP